MAAGIDATIHAAKSTTAFAAMRLHADNRCCISILAAPLCQSPATTRIATNGSRKTAPTSHALKVGAQMPTSGEKASPTPAAVPFRPLASPYRRTALIKVKPTSGPIATSSTHHARDDASSRHSLWRSQPNAVPFDTLVLILRQAQDERPRSW